ncbi:MAG: DNA repair exonuclease [Verrucomicrobiales bacterium]|nr:DNA repair exonuclease [Verrucomicrobiales bacterium]
MSTRFIHTADWQLGKPFAGVEDGDNRALLRNQRLEVLRRIGEAARTHHAEFVLVAGDLFDSPSATRPVVAAACRAIGAMGVPVYAIPGNHDHGGPGSLWEQDFFRSEREALAPNLTVLLTPGPVELGTAVLFPCPLRHRHETVDPTAWLRSVEGLDARFGDKTRIVLAHGSVQDFGAGADEDEANGGPANFLDLGCLDDSQFDYLALGDWHGTKRITSGSDSCSSSVRSNSARLGQPSDRVPRGGDKASFGSHAAMSYQGTYDNGVHTARMTQSAPPGVSVSVPAEHREFSPMSNWART